VREELITVEGYRVPEIRFADESKMKMDFE
jgi:hypothetical protein